MHVFSLCHTGFGLNTNIFETNILNLIVVIAFVFVNVGKAFTEMLDTRRDGVLKTIARAEEKYQEAQAALKQAKLQYIKAKYKAVVIRSDGRVLLKRLAIVFLKNAHDEQVRLLKTEYKKTLLLEKQSMIAVQGSLLKSIFNLVPGKCIKRVGKSSSVLKTMELKSVERFLLSNAFEK